MDRGESKSTGFFPAPFALQERREVSTRKFHAFLNTDGSLLSRLSSCRKSCQPRSSPAASFNSSPLLASALNSSTIQFSVLSSDLLRSAACVHWTGLPGPVLLTLMTSLRLPLCESIPVQWHYAGNFTSTEVNRQTPVLGPCRNVSRALISSDMP